MLRYIADPIPAYVASVNGVYTGTTAGTIFDASSTQRIRIRYMKLSCFVATVLAGNETAGDYLIAYDSVVTAPIAVLGILPSVDSAAGTIFGTSASGNTTYTTAATVWSTAQALPHEQEFVWPGGYTCTAAGNDIKFGLVGSDDGALEDVSTGQIRVVGTIGYDVI
jgi:hypothetical protein